MDASTLDELKTKAEDDAEQKFKGDGHIEGRINVENDDSTVMKVEEDNKPNVKAEDTNEPKSKIDDDNYEDVEVEALLNAEPIDVDEMERLYGDHSDSDVKVSRIQVKESTRLAIPSRRPKPSPLNNLPDDIAAILDLVATDHLAPPPSAIAPVESTSAPLTAIEAPNGVKLDLPESDSSSDWDSSESEAEPPSNRMGTEAAHPSSDEDDEGAPPPKTAPKTPNEVIPDVRPPELLKFEDGEAIEPIGELVSVIENVVIVKGTHGGVAEKVLDMGTLLSWDDRNVIGEIYETFGPTHAPLYSIRLPNKSETPSQVFKKGRAIYHSPKRSAYVFTRTIQALKGSDASNGFDEEVPESELEDFSDDEKEREWRSKYEGLSRRNRHRVRQGRDSGEPMLPPPPPPTDDGDFPFNPAYYDEQPVASTSYASSSRGSARRPAPKPYDDDAGALPYDADDDAMSVASSAPTISQRGGPPPTARGQRPRGRGGRGYGDGHRSGGRGRGNAHRGRGGRGASSHSHSRSHSHSHSSSYPQPPQHQFTSSPPDPTTYRGYDPTQPAMSFAPQYPAPHMSFPHNQQPFDFAGGDAGGGFVGHINPNFFAANMMAMNMNMGMGMGMNGWGYGEGFGFEGEQQGSGQGHQGGFSGQWNDQHHSSGQ